MLALLLLALSGIASADDWVCRSQSSLKRDEGHVLACGIGLAEDEARARELALANALTEFRRTCEASDDCREREVRVRPGRTECERTDDNGWVCYRAVEVAVSERARDLDEELAKQVRKLAAVKKQKAQAEELGDTDLELRLETEHPSYLSVGAGLTLGTTNFYGKSQLQVGYGLSLKRCFSDVVCPKLGLTTGKILFESEYTGTFVSGKIGLDVFVYKRLYLFGDAGLEYQWGNRAVSFGPHFDGGLGVEAIRVKNVSIAIETGAKGGPQNQVNPLFGVFANFKF